MGKPLHQWLRLTALALALLLLTPAARVTRADDASDLKAWQEKLGAAEASKRAAQSQLEQIYWQREETRAKLGLAQNELTNANARLEVTGVQLKTTQNELAGLKKAVADTEVKAQQQQQRFHTRLRVISERGQVSYLGVLFGSASFSDFISRADRVKAIIRYDTDLLRQVRDTKRQLEEQRDQVAERERSFLALQADQKQYAQVAAVKVTELQQLRAALAVQEKALQAQVAEAERQREIAEAEIYAVQLRMKRAGGAFAPVSPLRGHPPITSHFGYREDPWPSNHGGTDLGAPSGTPVMAIEEGVVIYTGWDSTYGNRIVLDHGGGIASWYGHLSVISVKYGQTVKQGETIGKVGSTGLSTGPHLHLEIRINNVKKDAETYIEF